MIWLYTVFLVANLNGSIEMGMERRPSPSILECLQMKHQKEFHPPAGNRVAETHYCLELLTYD